MIPTLILLGLLVGRWWGLAMIVGTAGWPAVLLTGGVVRTGPGLLAATGLAAINTGVGVLLYQSGFRVVRLLRHHGAPTPAPDRPGPKAVKASGSAAPSGSRGRRGIRRGAGGVHVIKDGTAYSVRCSAGGRRRGRSRPGAPSAIMARSRAQRAAQPASM